LEDKGQGKAINSQNILVIGKFSCIYLQYQVKWPVFGKGYLAKTQTPECLEAANIVQNGQGIRYGHEGWCDS
jgi:hypothetical protein